MTAIIVVVTQLYYNIFENAFWANGNPLVIAESLFTWIQFLGFALNILDIGWYQYDFKILRVLSWFSAMIFNCISEIIFVKTFYWLYIKNEFKEKLKDSIPNLIYVSILSFWCV